MRSSRASSLLQPTTIAKSVLLIPMDHGGERTRSISGLWDPSSSRPVFDRCSLPTQRTSCNQRRYGNCHSSNEELKLSHSISGALTTYRVRRGCLFHDSGSRKSLLVHSLAGSLMLDIFIISLSASCMNNATLLSRMGRVPARCIVLLPEDLDWHSLAHLARMLLNQCPWR